MTVEIKKMHSVQSYLERQPEENLRGMIGAYCIGAGDVSVDMVLLACRELARRDPQLPDPYTLFLSLCRMYL